MSPRAMNSGRSRANEKQESDRPTKKVKKEGGSSSTGAAAEAAAGHIPDTTTNNESAGGRNETSSANERTINLKVDTSQPPDDNKTVEECLPDIAKHILSGTNDGTKSWVKQQKISHLRASSNISNALQKSVDFDLDVFLNTGTVYLQIDREIGRLCDALQDFGFDEKLTHSEDVDAFMAQLGSVQKWHTDAHIRGDYIAPILPVIQSSGTGKSRLLYEARNFGNEVEAGREKRRQDSSPVGQGKQERHGIKHHYRSILLTARDKDVSEIQKYDKVHQIEHMDNWDYNKRVQEKNALRELVETQCRNCSLEQGEHYVTLLFDEAQHLTQNDSGFLFRALRWMTREHTFTAKGSSEAVYRITVAVAGTNSSLADFFPESIVRSKGISSRYQDEKRHYDGGKKLFPPFFMLRTQGCLSKRNYACKGSPNLSEYETMIRFSRPLFSKLHREGLMNEKTTEFDIAYKMVLYESGDNWIRSRRSCLSVLATRVQMGATSTSIVSTLVSKGYAHLTYFQQGDDHVPSSASFAFLPDPVCARIAMCLTDEQCELQKKEPGDSPRSDTHVVKGIARERIVDMMGTIFSDGMCLPAKGDFGEIAVALYLLFCGDILRKEHSTNDGKQYHQLSVDLSRWMDTVWAGGKQVESRATKSGRKNVKPRAAKSGRKQVESRATKWDSLYINCIQFFRLSLTCPLSDLGSRSFLLSLYEKGCAVYCATNTEAIDVVIPCYDKLNEDYLPVYISIKNYAQMCPQEAFKFLQTSYRALIDSGVEKGLLLLGIAGQDRETVECTAYEKKWKECWKQAQQSTVSTGFGRGDDILVTAKTIPENRTIQNDLLVGFFLVQDDEFGIHDMLKKTSFVKNKQKAEVYAMHSELIHGGSSDAFSLPRSYRNDAKNFFEHTKGCVDKDLKDETKS